MEKPAAGSKGLPLPMGAVASSNGTLLPGAVLPGLGLNAPPAEQNTVNALERHEQELSRMEAEQQAKEEQEKEKDEDESLDEMKQRMLEIVDQGLLEEAQGIMKLMMNMQ